jgi:DNA-binding Lrp family transcriptional regulator
LVHKELDDLDRRILAKFQNDAGVQYAACARRRVGDEFTCRRR